MRRSVPTERLKGLLDAERGLTTAEAASRRELYGWNDIVEAPPGAWRELARETLRDPMLWFLVGTAALFAGLGDYAEAGTLFCAVLPLIGMDAYLHRRTQASTRGLAGRLATTARVVRDAAWAERTARELVPGDLVEVTSGESFPADGLLLTGANVQVDESLLSGESLPVRKQPLTKASDANSSVEGVHWVVAGTRLLTGRARVRLAYTGTETLYGEIVRLALQGTHARTPLQAAIGRLVAVLLAAALLMCVILAAIRLHQGYGIVDALLSAVTLAVAALPEEFPIVFTFFLGAGVYRLAKRQALVRRAVAVENIGRITCICSDKTGTMTEGRLVLAHRDPAQGVGTGQLVELTALASSEGSGDPLDTAILGLVPASICTGMEIVGTFPFTEARRCETAVWRLPSGEYLAVVKGAPETVLARSTITDNERADWLGRVAEYAAAGHKVIACATRTLGVTAVGGEPDGGFQFRGLLAFEDPLREGVREAVRTCTDAGIRVIMLTGDHPGTARAIAEAVGLGDGRPNVVVMDEIDSASSADNSDLLHDVDVVARAVPAQKLSLVKMLQEQGEIVAVTGDGVNDVPALQAADIGIAMGERGTRSAREVAAIVLLDDNFRTIAGAIAEGRQLFRNLQVSFSYLLMVHIPLVLSAAIVPLRGYALLYFPIHIIWLELVIHPTALLVFQDPPPANQMAPVKRGHGAGFYGLWAWTVIALVGLAVTAATVFSYEHALGVGRDTDHARAIALAVLIIASVTITGILSGLKTWTARIIVTAAVASLVLLVQLPTLAALIHLHPLHLEDWAIAVGVGVFTGGLSALLGGRRTAARSRTAVSQEFTRP
ncbi:MAG: cation-transporting P-type ATPase [Proteobacteria bacterium]|nr:cation-transporting P-type ATPase [Pseudomonadota bacterium]